MKIKSIPSSWLRASGRRLDSGPYTSDGLVYRRLLQELDIPKDRLVDVTEGGEAGIFIAPYFKRNYLSDPEHGVPLLGNTHILMADPLMTAPLIPQKTYDENYEGLRLKAGWILITCFGTVGNMAYCRKNLEHCAGSTNFMRVVADSDKILSGYLYGYLSSKYGRALVTQSETGSVIPNLLPSQMADLPVPRLGDAVEQRVHALVEEAAQLRSDAANQRHTIIERVTNLFDWQFRSLSHLFTETRSSNIQRRLDAFHHIEPVKAARDVLSNGAGSVQLGEIIDEVFEPNRGARIKVEHEEFGVPFLSSSAVFRLDPTGEYLISRKRTSHLERLLVEPNDLLLPRSGQLGGIIGRAVLPLPTYYEHAASEHLVRVRCLSQKDAFYLWAIFASQPGYFASIGTAFGSSIPSLDCGLLHQLRIPWFDTSVREEIISIVSGIVDSLTKAIYAEREAVTLVEQAIEEAA